MKKVHFSVNMNTQGAHREKTFTFEELNIDENLTGDELDTALGEAYNEWVWDHLNGGFEIVES